MVLDGIVRRGGLDQIGTGFVFAPATADAMQAALQAPAAGCSPSRPRRAAPRALAEMRIVSIQLFWGLSLSGYEYRG